MLTIALDYVYPIVYSWHVLTTHQTEVFSKWLNKLLDRKGRALILSRIARMELGHFGDAKSVGAGVSELRISFGPGYRVYFTKRGEEVVILLCGGDKGSQSSDIKKAQEMAAKL